MNRRIDDIATLIRGVSYKPEDLHPQLDDTSVALLKNNNINDDGSISFDKVVYVDKSKVSSNQLLRPGDIIVCASGSDTLVGKAAQFNTDGEYTFGAFCKVVRPHSVNKRFLGLFFMSPHYRSIIARSAQGAIMKNLRNEHLLDLTVDCPEDKLQEDIESKLDRVISIIRHRKDQLRILDSLIKARFVEMFGDPRTNPNGYEVEELRSSCTVVTGNTPPRSVEEYYGDGIEWIKTDNIVSGRTSPTQAVECLSEKGMKVGRIVDEDAILMACIAGSIASIGRVCITDRKVAFNQQINAVIPKHYDVRFLYVLLQLSKDYLVEEINMALKGILSKSKLEDKAFFVPPMELQEQFATFVSQVDKSKVVVQKALDEAQVLFDSLMQQYFG